MLSRRFVFASSLLATAASFFTLGVLHARRTDAVADAVYDAKLAAVRAEVRSELGESRRAKPVATAGEDPAVGAAPRGARSRMVAEIKRELQSEMGLLPVHLLRERRTSFVELYANDTAGKVNYGTAGYLGHGYFITVKHAVVALPEDGERPPSRKITSVKIVYQGKEIAAKVVDTGDAKVEVDRGDWAIIKTRELDLPPLHVNASFGYDFASPIFRLGNDYSKGIILATGYIGQRTSNGLVTCLTDGHPGVSGGGVLDQQGDLIGIPIGRMQGDYRFSFILPVRAQMLRKVPGVELPEAAAPPAIPLEAEQQQQ